MKKVLVVFFTAIFLVACQSNNDPELNDAQNDNDLEQVENEMETEIEKKETDKENESEESDKSDEMNDSSTNSAEEDLTNEPSNEEEESEELEAELITLGEAIFQAQFDGDTDYLNSVLAKGVKIEEETFLFENVTHPHEQNFLTEETAADIEFRYTHKNDENSYIVGFAAIDMENEYSYVIDFEFIHEDDGWKMNDMDINK